MPSLFYARRCKHDNQYLYTGGWLIDDGALYENTLTLLISEGPTEVVGVSAGDVDGDGYGDLISRRLSRARSRYGTMVFSGVHDPDADYLPEALRTSSGSEKGYDYYRAKSDVSRTQTGDNADVDRGKVTGTSVMMALDAPVFHLVEAAALSNDVKFKAGAELSKAVN